MCWLIITNNSHIKGEIWSRFKLKSIKRVNIFEQWKFEVNRIQNKEDMKFWISIIFPRHISWTVDMSMQMNELMMSMPHNFPCTWFTKMMKIPYHFSFEKVITCPISTLNKMQNNVCSDIILITYYWGTCYCMFEHIKQNYIQKYMENCEAMRSSTHSFAYSYQLFKKCFVENFENSKISYLPYFCIRFTSNFHCSIWNVLIFLLNNFFLPGPGFPL